jgi:hypothetical protein
MCARLVSSTSRAAVRARPLSSFLPGDCETSPLHLLSYMIGILSAAVGLIVAGGLRFRDGATLSPLGLILTIQFFCFGVMCILYNICIVWPARLRDLQWSPFIQASIAYRTYGARNSYVCCSHPLRARLRSGAPPALWWWRCRFVICERCLATRDCRIAVCWL